MGKLELVIPEKVVKNYTLSINETEKLLLSALARFYIKQAGNANGATGKNIPEAKKMLGVLTGLPEESI